jgi:methyltransferase family protein
MARKDVREPVNPADVVFSGGWGGHATSTLDGVLQSRALGYDRGYHTTDRGGSGYCRILGLDLAAFFAGKTLLDMGAGYDGAFAKSAQSEGIRVISLNPFWATEQYAEWYQRARISLPERFWPTGTENGKWPWVGGAAQQLPLANESVDGIVAVNSVPTYLPGTEWDYRATFEESLRVMRCGGFAVYGRIQSSLLVGTPLRSILDEVAGRDRYGWGTGNDDGTAITTLFVAATAAVQTELVESGIARPA